MTPEDFTVHATGPLLEDATVRYIIDSKSSSFVVKAFSKGLLSAFGHDPKIAVREFQGNASFTPNGGALDTARVDIRIQANSLEVADDVSDKDRQEINHRMHTEVLETDRFPEIVYECSQVRASGGGDRYWAALNGELTLHGVTQPMPVSSRVVIEGNVLRASGEFTVRQSEYEIAPVSAAGGAIRVKDELKCTFDIVARKQE
jgi:polyisoprenoid-binding protein YceI